MLKRIKMMLKKRDVLLYVFPSQYKAPILTEKHVASFEGIC